MHECQSFAQLIQSGNNLMHLDKYAGTCVQQSIVNYFVLPWIGVSNAEQDFERRSLLLKEYTECLAHDLMRLDHTVENGQDNKVGQKDYVRNLHTILIFCFDLAFRLQKSQQLFYRH